MGGGSSKLPAVAEAEKMFTSAECEMIKKHLGQMMVSPNAFGFNQPAWETFVADKMCNELQEKLFAHMLRVENEAGIESPRLIAPGGYVISLAQFLKGTLAEKTRLVVGLCGSSDKVTTDQVIKTLKLLLSDYCRYISTLEEHATWKLRPYNEDTISHLASSIAADLPRVGDAGEISQEALEKWLTTSVLLLQILDNMMHYVFPMGDDETRDPVFPRCANVDWQKHTTDLDIPAILFLNQYLPSELCELWRHAFSIEAHGESFARLVKLIANQGPSIVMIRDTQGHQFGGFASQSWQLGPNFVGSSRCFLFSIKPEMATYLATGINENYMYFNQGQETMPNGLGFGGQLDYFGLWLDSEVSKGNSRAEPRCSTYNSPQLSAQPHFQVSRLEIWALGPDPKLVKLEDEDGNEKKDSILDKDPGAKAMLSLLGKGPISEGLRETDPMAGSPEDDKNFPS